MSTKALENIAYALGLATNAIRQKEAFLYVMENNDKNINELAIDINQKGKVFSSNVESSAERVASYVSKLHKERNDDGLKQKWCQLFSEEERGILTPSSNSTIVKSVYFSNDHLTKQQTTEFSVKVMRKAVQHYLEDIRAFDKAGKLHPDELDILNGVKGNQPEPALKQDERLILQLIEAGFLQCDLNR
ncbi:hypothetical protein HW132_12700 [Brasilonema sp. CT11]|nr:hypothetical protein [Brasilonema sp. CT11]